MTISRRKFLVGVAAAATVPALPAIAAPAEFPAENLIAKCYERPEQFIYWMKSDGTLLWTGMTLEPDGKAWRLGDLSQSRMGFDRWQRDLNRPFQSDYVDVDPKTA